MFDPKESSRLNLDADMASGSAPQDNGEFTDNEDYGIPLEDIREAEFERLEDFPPSREVVRSSPLNKSSWLPWMRFRRRQRDLGSYLPVEEEDETRLRRKKSMNNPLITAEVAEVVKEFSCDSKLGWGILYF